MHRSNYQLYSITLSARLSISAGTSSPIALAVFRLMIISYLFKACTGIGAGDEYAD
jgi:hypothetical protein